MTSQHPIRPRRGAPFAAALALLLALVAGMPAGAETNGSVTVSAGVTNQELSLTLCDTEANFGQGLDSHGAAPIDTTDAVIATTEGIEPGQGVFYRWTPSCQADGVGVFLTVESNISWRDSACMGPETGTNPDLTGQDLTWAGWEATAYWEVHGASFDFSPSCPGTPISQTFGNRSTAAHLYLRVDDHVGNGTFATTVTWSVTPD